MLVDTRVLCAVVVVLFSFEFIRLSATAPLKTVKLPTVLIAHRAEN
jgi:hypothetical protein